MADQIILADTSIFIEHFRKSDKSNSKLFSLNELNYKICISVITEYEIYSGAPKSQAEYWRKFLIDTIVLDLNSSVVNAAVHIAKALKEKRKLIGMADLFIAATAVNNNIPISTLNKKHFERIDGLILID